jgi:hypothetical protein
VKKWKFETEGNSREGVDNKKEKDDNGRGGESRNRWSIKWLLSKEWRVIKEAEGDEYKGADKKTVSYILVLYVCPRQLKSERVKCRLSLPSDVERMGQQNLYNISLREPHEMTTLETHKQNEE